MTEYIDAKRVLQDAMIAPKQGGRFGQVDEKKLRDAIIDFRNKAGSNNKTANKLIESASIRLKAVVSSREDRARERKEIDRSRQTAAAEALAAGPRNLFDPDKLQAEAAEAAHIDEMEDLMATAAPVGAGGGGGGGREPEVWELEEMLEGLELAPVSAVHRGGGKTRRRKQREKKKRQTKKHRKRRTKRRKGKRRKKTNKYR